MTAYKLARDIPILMDPNLCYRTLAKLRAAHGACPRCGSSSLDGSDFGSPKSRTESSLRCWKCGHRFSFGGGTFVMGANRPVIRYAQLYVLINALGEALTRSMGCLATGVAHGSVIEAMRHRISLVDPKIVFTTVDPELAARLISGTHSADSFSLFCDMSSILVDEGEFLRSLAIAISTQVPELVDRYKKRGKRESNIELVMKAEHPSMTSDVSVIERDIPKQLAGSDAQLRKEVALAWLKTFSSVVPSMSAKLRTNFAWRLANLNVSSDEELVSLDPDSLFAKGQGSGSLTGARIQYLEALTRYTAVQKMLNERAHQSGASGLNLTKMSGK